MIKHLLSDFAKVKIQKGNKFFFNLKNKRNCRLHFRFCSFISICKPITWTKVKFPSVGKLMERCWKVANFLSTLRKHLSCREFKKSNIYIFFNHHNFRLQKFIVSNVVIYVHLKYRLKGSSDLHIADFFFSKYIYFWWHITFDINHKI